MSNGNHGDIRVIVPAQGALNIPVRGEFVFYKSGAAVLKTVIHDSPVEMEPGDIRRYNNRPFNSFEIHNDKGIDVDVVLVVGFGEYNRLVVRGEISSFDSLIGVDGVPRPDTRHSFLHSIGLVEPNELQGDKNEFFGGPFGEFGSGGLLSGYAVFVNKLGELVVSDGDTVSRYGVGGLIGSYTLASKGFATDSIYWARRPDGSVVAFLSSPQYGLYECDELTGEPLSLIGSSGGLTGGQFLYLGNGTFIGSLGGGNFAFVTPGSSQVNNVNLQSDLGMPVGSFVPAVSPLDGDEVIFLYVGGGGDNFAYNHSTGVVRNLGTAPVWSVGSVPGMVHSDWLLKKIYYVDTVSAELVEYALEDTAYWGSGNGKDLGFPMIKNKASVALRKASDSTGHYFVGDEWSVDVIRQVCYLKWFRAGKAGNFPVDYLDFVHRLSINGVLVYDTGSRSFALEGLVDTFVIKNPSIIELTISNELEPN